MATLDLTDEEIRTRGLEALHRELGPAGMVRFLRQFELGRGDYSAERHQWLRGQSLEDLIGELRGSRRCEDNQ
ncbi:MAG: hypothetical protein AAB225_06785 [Acidobacteriota bacterium]